MSYYVIKYLYEKYTLQEYQNKDEQVSKTSELIVKAEYLSFMKEKNKQVLVTSCNKSECGSRAISAPW